MTVEQLLALVGIVGLSFALVLLERVDLLLGGQLVLVDVSL